MSADKDSLFSEAEWDPSVNGDDKGNETKYDNILRTLSDEGIERSSEIASLIQRAASQNRPDLVKLIGQYNRAKGADPLQKP